MEVSWNITSPERQGWVKAAPPTSFVILARRNRMFELNPVARLSGDLSGEAGRTFCLK